MSVVLSAHGLPAVQNVEAVHWGQIQEFLKFEELMKAMSIGIHCRYCTQAFGPPADGIHIKIHEADRMVTLSCNHKERRFKVQTDEQMKILLNH